MKQQVINSINLASRIFDNVVGDPEKAAAAKKKLMTAVDEICGEIWPETAPETTETAPETVVPSEIAEDGGPAAVADFPAAEDQNTVQ